MDECPLIAYWLSLASITNHEGAHWLSGRVLDSRPRGRTTLCPWARHIKPSLVLVQPRKTHPYITERLLMGLKESNQTNKQIMRCSKCCLWQQSSHDRMNLGIFLFIYFSFPSNLVLVLKTEKPMAQNYKSKPWNILKWNLPYKSQ